MSGAERRDKFGLGLHPSYKVLYLELCSALPDRWQPFWGLRTMDEQARLYAQGRTAPGAVVTQADAGYSAHNYGCASDWTIFNDLGEPQWMGAKNPAWGEYAAVCARLGLLYGGDFKSPDGYHNELSIGPTWGGVFKVFKSLGKHESDEFIRRNMIV